MNAEIQNPEMRGRAEWAQSLCLALEHCHPEDAKQICWAFLDSTGAGDPPHTPYGNVRDDAGWWADIAHPGELECYFAAALKRLGNRALGINARKRLFLALWQAFSDADRASFLRNVAEAET